MIIRKDFFALPHSFLKVAGVIVLTAVLCITNLQGQISCVVSDSLSGQAIGGIPVMAQTPLQLYQTDTSGVFVWQNRDSVIRISLPGYLPATYMYMANGPCRLTLTPVHTLAPVSIAAGRRFIPSPVAGNMSGAYGWLGAQHTQRIPIRW